MLKTLKKFFDFCGKENRKLFIISIRLGVVSAICSAMRIPAAAVVIKALLDNNVTMSTLWTSLGIIVVSLIVTIAINMKSTMLQTKAGYRACADKRIEIAEHLRAKCAVVLNLEQTNKDVARRLVDFLSGCAYALDGKIKKVAVSTYIITPYNVDIVGDLIDELENNGLYL